MTSFVEKATSTLSNILKLSSQGTEASLALGCIYKCINYHD
eukprot:UN19347